MKRVPRIPREALDRIRVQVDEFEACLLEDASAQLTASKRGLVEAACMTLAGALRIRYLLVHAQQLNVAEMTERVSWLSSNLARLLKQLGLDARSRPRTFQFAPRTARALAASETPQIESESST